MPVSSFRPGECYSFEYPRHNFHGVRSHFETRRIRVTSVRDVWASPLDRVTIELQPILRRGRLLITGEDLDKHAERSFYVDSIRNAEPLVQDLQVA